MFYSVLNASTGSFLAANREGITPAINVKVILIATNISAATGGRYADNPSMPVALYKMALMGISISRETPIPLIHETNPTISVTTFNNVEISRFQPPIARSIPISLVRSRTEI